MKCFVARWQISNARDTERPVSEDVARHLSQCTHCRQFARNSQAMDAALSSEPRRASAAPEHLHTRIMASIREADREAKTAGIARSRLALFAGAAVVFAAVLFGTRLRPERKPEAAPGGSIAVSVTDIDEYRRLAARAASDASVAATLSMADELEYLKSDMASVGDYLLAYID